MERASSRVVLALERVRAGMGGHSVDPWSLASRAWKVAQSNPDFILCALGVPDAPFPEVAHRAMDEAIRAGETGYAEPRGLEELRAELASWHEELGGGPTSVDEVVVTAGAQQGLSLAALATVSPGESVIVRRPVYPVYEDTLAVAGAYVEWVECLSEIGAAVDRAAEAGRPARAVLVNSPCNPTGRVVDRATLEAVAAVSRDRDLWILSDEVYSGIAFDGVQCVSPTDVCRERTIAVNSLSKTLAMPAARIGWTVSPPAMALALERLAVTQVFGLSPFVQRGALAALRRARSDDLLRNLSRLYEQRRDAFLEGVRPAVDAGLLEAPAPRGGMFALVGRRSDGDDVALAERCLAHDLGVVPGGGFRAPGFVRVGLLNDRMREAGRRLAAAAGAKDDGPRTAPPPARVVLAYGPGYEEPAVRSFMEVVRASFPASWDVVDGDERGDGRSEHTPDIAAVNHLPSGVRLESLKFVANLGVGVDHIIDRVPVEVPLTRLVDETAQRRFAHWVLAACLNAARSTFGFKEAQARKRWDQAIRQRDPSEMEVLILGSGTMGRAALDALKSSGFDRARCWRRGDLGAVSSADIAVVALPSTPHTRALVDGPFLATLPRGAALVSAGRGDVVDERALLASLDEGHLGEAILDVFVEEPLPASSPLWDHPRVTITPHVAAWPSPTATAHSIVKNWARFHAGLPLVGLVDRDRGY